MTKIDTFNQEGKKQSQVSLKDEVFNVEINKILLQQSLVTEASNKRKVISKTKTRGERAGSTRKPWRQKGTGRARVGSVRSPLWRGGGIIFGPKTERNFSKNMPKKMRTKSILMALSSKISDKKVIVLDKIVLKQAKTKEMEAVLNKLKVEGSILLILPELTSENNLIIKKSSKNLPYLKVIPATSLNVFDVLNNNHLIFTKDAIKKIEGLYGG